MLNRRKLITGLISFAAAPAIVRASSLMPVKVMDSFDPWAIINEMQNKLLATWDIGMQDRSMLIRYECTGLVIKTISEEEFYANS